MSKKLLIGAGSVMVLTLLTAGAALAAPGRHFGGFPLNGLRASNFMRPAMVGTVSNVNGNILTVNAQQGFGSTSAATYTVDATNATVMKNNATSSVANIAVGDTLAIQGTVNGTNVIATAIRDGVRGSSTNYMRPMVVGTVSNVNGNLLTITGRQGFGSTNSSATYTVDATNATVMKNNATSSVANIAVGDIVAVQGTANGTNVAATYIRDGVRGSINGRGWGVPVGQFGQNEQNGSTTLPIQGNGQPIVAGKVTAINSPSLTITNSSNVNYTIDATNATVVVGRSASTLGNVSVGDTVIVQGAVNGNQITASSIIDKPMSTTPIPGQATGNYDFFGRVGQFFKHLFGF